MDVVDEFLSDLAEAVERAKKTNLRKIGDKLLIKVGTKVASWLPEKIVTQITTRAAGLLGVRGASLPKRSAAMYGMMGSLPNRGDIKEMVLDIVEEFTEPQEE
jgi:hypothetical protein